MTRKFVLSAVLIGFALILLPSTFSSNAGAPSGKSSKSQRMKRSAPAPQSKATPSGTLPFTVDSTVDDSDIMPGDGVCETEGGDCTLRAAIQESNATPGADAIEFNIPGSGVRTILVVSPLPTITSPVTIDGTTQPGFAGTPLIRISRFSPGVVGNGLTITGGGTEISGLIINGFSGHGILLQSSGGNIIRGNFIGTDPTGNGAAGNGGDGIQVNGSVSNTIGDSADLVNATSTNSRNRFVPMAFSPGGNLISANTGSGISIVGGTTGTFIGSNFIGTNASGTAALGNQGAGVLINGGAENTIGSSFSGNLISANSTGIEIQGASSVGNPVQGNLIGTNASGTSGLGNTLFGIAISGGSNNTIGGDPEFGESNTIAFNGDDGIAVLSGVRNAITGNSIFSNGGLGIDLGTSGVTPNDSCDGDGDVANDLQNFPLLTSAVTGMGGVTISGTLDSEPLEDYTVEFFANSTCDPSGNGEGRDFIGSTTVSIGMPCTMSFSVPFASLPPGASFITATATDSQGNTSEFSPCVAVTGSGSADLAISNSDSPDPVATGSQLTYTIIVTNNGPDTATGATVTDAVPSSTNGGYTFASVTTSQGSCTSPAPGGTGTVNCSLGPISSGNNATVTLIVNVIASPTSTLTNTAVVNGTPSDPNSSNNSATATTAVVSGCAITCPSNVTTTTGPNAARCGAIVNYPTPSASCTTVTCTPASGSFFPVGTTSVTCSSGISSNCVFFVTVVDAVPPRITCPENITTTPDQGQRSRVVNYPAPFVSDNCTVFSVNCTPPSGSTFTLGTTTVVCSASDSSENVSTCSFTVTVTDTQPPTIACPGNVVVQATGGQCAAVVNFSNPNITGSPIGTGVVCVPPAGSAFPTGTTVITCTATTPAGVRATCSFSVTVNGPPQAKVTLEANKTELGFGPTNPVRKSKKKPPASCDCSETFMIENTGCGVLGLNLASIMRTGSDVDSGRITDPDDSTFYTVTILNPDGTERPATCAAGVTPCITINPGQKLTFRVVFKPIIPAAFSGKTRGLAASEVVPERITSKITFNQQGGAPLVINMVGRVSPTLRLIDPVNPRKPKRVIFERSGNEFTVTYAVFDSNLDVNRSRFEFFDDQGRQVGQAIDVELAGAVSAGNLVRGQSFVVVQKFTGARDNPEVRSVRVTVSDPESSDTETGTLSSSSSAASIETQSLTRGVVLFPPRSRLNP